MQDPSRAISFSQGYVIRTPGGTMLSHSYRKTEAEAIASVFTDTDNRDTHWQQAEAAGCTVEFVYARIFTPAYFAVQVLQADGEEDAA